MISCDKHDYVEIACLYKFSVTLKLKNKEQMTGTAITVSYNKDKQECLLLETNEQQEVLIELTSINIMTANQNNPHFSSVELN